VVDDRELASELTDDVQPFTMIQNAFLDDAALSAVAFRVFIILKSYTSGRAKTKLAFPSYSTLKARCNISGNTTLAKAIRELESAGWIKRDKRFGRSSLYTLRAITPKTGIVAITPEIGAQSAKNWPNSPPKTGMYQEVPKQEVAKQEVGGAPPVVPLVSVKGYGKVYTAHPDARVAAYLDIMGQPHITASNAQIILDRVALEFVEVWRNVLTLWASSAWNPRNISGMIERYEGDKNAKRFPKPAAAQPIGEWRPAKGMYPQVPDPTPAEFAAAEERAKVQRAERAARKAVPVEYIDHSKTTEAPF